MRILVATDTSPPEVNGVVSTYARLEPEVKVLGAEMIFLTTEGFPALPFPAYPEVRLALPSARRIAERIRQAAPDAIHIATEGPIGIMTRAYCLKRAIPFTTSYHTRFPEYLKTLLGVPAGLTYAALKHFHARSAGVMVATPSLRRELNLRGFNRLLPWTRGVDTSLFHPRPVRLFGEDSPVFLYVGRVSREKNIEAFLDADLAGRKVVTGAGPHLAALAQRYPHVTFTGSQSGEELACHYASADVFVFPSRTDTFGLVMLEAMASGLPVAAYRVTGPLDIVEQGVSGVLDDDLSRAARRALTLRPEAARARALIYSWPEAARLFLANIDNVRRAALAGTSQRSAPQTPSGRGGSLSPRSPLNLENAP